MLRRPAVIISHWYMLVEALQTSTLDFYTSVEAVLQRRAVPKVKTQRIDWQEGGLFSSRRRYLRLSRGRFAFDVCAAPYGKDFFFSWRLILTPPRFGMVYALLLILTGWGVFAWCINNRAISLLPNSVIPWLQWARPWAGQVVGGVAAMLAILVDLILFHLFGGDDAILAIPVVGWLYNLFFVPETYYRIDTALMFQEAVRTAVMEAVDGVMSAKGLRKLSDAERQPRLNEKALR
jgi:hypothetical protein